MRESLYELTAEVAPLEKILEAEGGELTEQNQQLVERVTELLGKIADKIDGYGKIVKNLEARAKFIKEEKMRLGERQAVIENGIKRLKDAAKLSLEMRDIVKVEGNIFTVSVQPNGGERPIRLLVPVNELPEQFVKRDPQADMQAIRSALERGEDPAVAKVAEYLPRGTQLRIR